MTLGPQPPGSGAAVGRSEDLAALLARIQGMRLDAGALVEGLLSGHHRSPHHGVSVEFAEHKDYAPGDELRSIDWKAFGRTDRLLVKRFHHETDLTARIIVDTSGSMAYGGGAGLKARAAGILALSAAYVLLRQGDRVGLTAASDRIRGHLPPRSGLSHFQALGDLLEQSPPQGETAIGPVLEDELERLGRRRAVLIFSDCFEDPESLFRPIRALRARQCSVVLVQVLHSDELELPFEEVREFRSMERPDHPESRLIAEPQLIRALYLRRLAEHLDRVTDIARMAQVAYHLVRSDEPLDPALFALLRGGLP